MWKKLIDWLATDEAKEWFDGDWEWSDVVEKACELNRGGAIELWTNGESLFMPGEYLADMADAFNNLCGEDAVSYFYYSVKEDIDNDDVDRMTGWGYIHF